MKRFFVLGAVLACAVASPAYAGIGAIYGTRDPHTCASTTAPKSGPITPTLAAKYFTCQFEKEDSDGYLWLTENVKAQVGAGVPYGATRQYRPRNVDPGTLLYALRGSFDKYLCGKVNRKGYMFDGHREGVNLGKNCTLWHARHATGSCYRTVFGDWKCSMVDLDAKQIEHQPPPQDTGRPPQRNEVRVPSLF